jgi:hypothetical protein
MRGELPTTRDQAKDLAALYAQVRYGNYSPEKHSKKGWLK